MAGAEDSARARQRRGGVHHALMHCNSAFKLRCRLGETAGGVASGSTKAGLHGSPASWLDARTHEFKRPANNVMMHVDSKWHGTTAQTRRRMDEWRGAQEPHLLRERSVRAGSLRRPAHWYAGPGTTGATVRPAMTLVRRSVGWARSVAAMVRLLLPDASAKCTNTAVGCTEYAPPPPAARQKLLAGNARRVYTAPCPRTAAPNGCRVAEYSTL